MNEFPLIDLLAFAVISLGVFRGVWIGLIREGLSLAALAICTIVTRLFVGPVSTQIIELTAGEISGKAALWIAGVLLVMLTIVGCGIVARILKRTAQFAGLGWADRLGGGALGFAEGAIVAAVIVLIALWLVGPDHPTTAGARSVEIVEEFRAARETGELPEVSAPGKWF